MPRTGRPRTDNPRTNAIPIRLTDAELNDVRTAATSADSTVGEWARNKLLAAARRANRRTPPPTTGQVGPSHDYGDK